MRRINDPTLFRSGMTQPSDPSRASAGAGKATKAKNSARRPNGPVAAREWDVAHAAALRALLTQPPAVLPNQVGDPLVPLQIGIWDALITRLRPEAEPDALARALRGRVAWIRGGGAMTPPPFWAHAMRMDSGRPSSSMRFRT